MPKEKSYGIIPIRFVKKEAFVLLIQHSSAGHWGFPKGHANVGEVPKEAAQRELLEETNLTIKRYLTDKLFKESYSFRLKDVLVFKEVEYFLAEVKGEVSLQKEEVKDYCWLPILEATDKASYPEIRKIIQEILDLGCL